VNRIVTLGVEPEMKPAHLLLAGLLFLIGTMAPPSAKAPHQTPVSTHSDSHSGVPSRSAANLSARVPDLQGVGTHPNPRVAQTIGGMWIEVDRLKREGQNVRAIEYYLSDLEASRRLGEQGSAASRYAANNLEYEIQRLNRRLGR
jgi:hypothetical protein